MSPAFIKTAAVVLTGLCFGTLALTLLRSFSEGARTYTGTYSDSTSRQLEDLFLFIPAKRIAEASWALAVAAFFLVFFLFFDPSKPIYTLVGLAAGFAAALGAFQIPRQIMHVMREKRTRKFNEQLVEALGQVSNALKAGFSATQAFETVVKNGENPIAQEFEVFLQQQRVGISFSEALENLRTRVGSEDLDLVCGAMEISRKTGGNLTEVFGKISETIRERMRIERRVLTLTAQGRLQGWIVGCMPVVVALAMVFFRPEVMIPYLHTPAGLASMAAVAVLLALGAAVIRKIIRIDV